jgi:hypothetical protein
MKRVVLAIAVLALLGATAGPTRADMAAFSITGYNNDSLGNPPFTLGWEFSTSSSITVTNLGLFAPTTLADDHPIGLWDSSGTLLATATAPAGSSATSGFFLYESITPVTLSAGTYMVGALYTNTNGADSVLFPGDAQGFMTSPGITFVQSAFASGGTLTDPTGSVSTLPGYFGPNLTFTGSAVPEPSTFALSGTMGLLMLVYAARKRRAAA